MKRVFNVIWNRIVEEWNKPSWAESFRMELKTIQDMKKEKKRLKEGTRLRFWNNAGLKATQTQLELEEIRKQYGT